MYLKYIIQNILVTFCIKSDHWSVKSLLIKVMLDVIKTEKIKKILSSL